MKTLAVESSNPGFELSAQSVTLVDLLEWRARVQAERVAYTFLVDGEQEIVSLSWSELHRKAQLIAQRLTSVGGRGDGRPWLPCTRICKPCASYRCRIRRTWRLLRPINSLASLLLILFAISRVMISQRRRCFSFKVIVPMLLACGHFH